MSDINSIERIDLTKVDEANFQRRYVGCIVLTQNHKIMLQQRGDDWLTFPGCLATFGGRIEFHEKPLQALVRELHEELGAQVSVSDITVLGAITEAITDHHELVHVYFWHDYHGTITGCYEGEAKYYDSVKAVLKHPKVMVDVCWLLNECLNLQLLKK